MPNPLCENCKPSENLPELNDIIPQTACTEVYEKAEICMKRNKGMISACNLEWQNFKNCLDSSKGDT